MADKEELKHWTCADEHYTGDTTECCDPVYSLKNKYEDLQKKLSKRDAIIKVCVEKFNAIVKHQEIVVGKGFARLSTTAAIANGAILEIERLKKEQP